MPSQEVDQILSFFAGETGVGVAPSASDVKVGEGKPPCYLEHTANLDDPDLVMPLYPPSHCKPRYIVLECACGRRIVPSSCMSLDCEHCKGQVGKRRADSVISRILGGSLYQKNRFFKQTVIYTVFTVPTENRKKFLCNGIWQKYRVKAWRLLRDHFGAKYAVEVTHPKGDSKTGLFHPHLNFIWVQKSGFRPFIDVDLLREKWGRILKVDISDVYSQYTNQIGKVIHWVRYVTRNFPGTHKWTGVMRWYGKYPRIKKPTECLCNECGGYFKLIGWVSAEDVDRWNETGWKMGIDPPWYRDACIIRVKPRKKNRPCGEDS